MSKGSSSKNWRRRQDTDPYVRRAQQEGWRSRAVYKLMEMDQKERLIRPGSRVLDLGAAPGAWSQYAARIAGESGRIIAVDLLPMDPLAGVEVIHGDFRDENIYEQVLQRTENSRFDLVMSDMAPNISGMKSVDQPRAMLLAELAAELAVRILSPRGALIVKLFHGEGFDSFVREMRGTFGTVKVRKPRASRPSSRETYLLARDIRL